MIRFLLRRLAVLVPTFVAVTLLSFLLIRLVPGDPIEVRSGERGIPPERLAQLRHEMGLDRPLWQQFVDYELQVAGGNLGRSVVTQESVWTEFKTLFPATLELAACAILFAVCLGLPLGVVAAVDRNGWFDYAGRLVSLVGVSFPAFVSGILLLLVFGIELGWFPVLGSGTGSGSIADELRYLALPAFNLGVIMMAYVMRVTRSSMLGVLGEDYIRTARAKGVRPARLVMRHALRNSLIPVVTVVGLYTGTLIGNSVLTEIIFNRPGLGKLILSALDARDYTLLQGLMVIFGICVVSVNALTDIAYGIIDPRVRYD